MMITDPATFLRQTVAPAVMRGCDAAAALDRSWTWPDGSGDGPVRVVAIGKAARVMAGAAERHLGDRFVGGLVVCPAGSPGVCGDRMRVMEADHPLATARNVLAARAVEEFIGGMGTDEVLAALISGGGSAMLSLPMEPLELRDLVLLTDDLLRSGATIGQVNCVRKHLEMLKGGKMARLCRGRVSAFVLSDVMGDRLDVIASGPFAPDPTSFADAIGVLETHGLTARHGLAVEVLGRGAAGLIAETPGPGDAVFARVEHVVIGNNALAVESGRAVLAGAGFSVVEVRRGVEGEAARAGRALGAAVRRLGAGEAVVWGGETTVRVGASRGVGGPNLEVALAAAIELEGEAGAAVMALATDGIDGVSPAAGAVVDGRTVGALRRLGFEPARLLAEHDSFAALAAAGATIQTGVTGTNVNDVLVGLRV